MPFSYLHLFDLCRRWNYSLHLLITFLILKVYYKWLFLIRSQHKCFNHFLNILYLNLFMYQKYLCLNFSWFLSGWRKTRKYVSDRLHQILNTLWKLNFCLMKMWICLIKKKYSVRLFFSLPLIISNSHFAFSFPICSTHSVLLLHRRNLSKVPFYSI